MKDYYNILGVPKGSSNEDIKRAFRKLAMQHHPDRGGNQATFQDINEAYSTLSDPAKRQSYDNPPAQPQFNFHTAGFNMNDLFGSMFQQAHQTRNPRLALWISLEDVARGGPKVVSLQINSTVSNVEIHVPQGINDGDTVRYTGLSPNGQDLVITYRIKPDAKWHRQGKDITTKQEVSLWSLVIGGEVSIVDLTGATLMLTIPPRTQPDSLMRVRGRGLPGNSLPGHHSPGLGDLFVKLQAKLPDNISDALLQAIQQETEK